jgi:hypothetical protein
MSKPPGIEIGVLHIMPGQMPATGRQSISAPWRRLVATVMIGAIEAIYRHGPKKDAVRREALRWIRERKVGALTFDEVCTLLGMDAGRTRERILDEYNRRQGGTDVAKIGTRGVVSHRVVSGTRVTPDSREAAPVTVAETAISKRVRRALAALPEPGSEHEQQGGRVPLLAARTPPGILGGGDAVGSDPLQAFMRRYG